MDRYTRGRIILHVDGVRMLYERNRDTVLLEQEIDDGAGQKNMSIEGKISFVYFLFLNRLH